MIFYKKMILKQKSYISCGGQKDYRRFSVLCSECLEENSCISGDMEKRRSHPLPVFSPSKILMKCRTLNFTFLPSLCRKKLYAFCGSFGKTKPANRRFSRKEKDQYLKKYLNDVKIQEITFLM